jgi:DNA-binding transcriptional regulator GbsR (MarR family)
MKIADLFLFSVRTLHFTRFAFFVFFFTWFNISPLPKVLKEIDELEDLINQMKKELNQNAKATGLNSHETLNCSQKLDQLITIYQNLYKKEKRNMLL